MKKTNLYALFLFVSIISIVGFTGCTSKIQTTNTPYDVAIVYTSISKEKSEITTYNQSGQQKDSVKLNVGGINLANFYKPAISTGEMVYFTMPVLGNKTQDFIIEVNKNDLSYRKIHSLDKRGITSFDADSNYAFLSVSDIENSTVRKID